MNGRMEYRGRKGSSVATVLAVSLLISAASAYGKAGRGAMVVVTLKGSVLASGELIHVRPASILILDTSGRDAAFDLAEISTIRVVRRSKAFQGALVGLLAGAGTGLLAGSLVTRGKGFDESFGTKLITFYGGGLAGLIVGGVAGGAAGRDLDIQIDGASPADLKGALEKMSKYARVKAAS